MEEILAAAKRAAIDAGYVNPETSHQTRRDGEIAVALRADCPCGLGTSSFAVAFRKGTQFDRPDVMADTAYRLFYQACLKHIEHDKAEGRWDG